MKWENWVLVSGEILRATFQELHAQTKANFVCQITRASSIRKAGMSFVFHVNFKVWRWFANFLFLAVHEMLFRSFQSFTVLIAFLSLRQSENFPARRLKSNRNRFWLNVEKVSAGAKQCLIKLFTMLQSRIVCMMLKSIKTIQNQVKRVLGWASFKFGGKRNWMGEEESKTILMHLRWWW